MNFSFLFYYLYSLIEINFEINIFDFFKKKIKLQKTKSSFEIIKTMEHLLADTLI